MSGHLRGGAPRWRVVSVLGVIEIFAWGSSFYLMAVLAGPMSRDMGWSAATLSAGVSTGLLVSGLAASWAGRAIQRWGGRRVLAAGLALLSAGLALLGLARGEAGFFLAWAVMGLGMSGCLYDAAFSTLGRIFGREARGAITQLTLWGGFASTLCWPLSEALATGLGWRGACFAYAGWLLLAMLPLARFALPPAGEPALRPAPALAAQPAAEPMSEAISGAPAAPPAPVAGPTDLRFLCIVAAGMTLSMLATILSVHLVTLLGGLGYASAAAIGVGAMMGPAQVGARLLEMLGRERHHPVWTLLASAALVLLGFAGMALGVPAGIAIVAFGAGNGLWSIARGALPLALFGPESYACVMGRLATPMLLASAAAPTLGGWLIETVGPRPTLEVMAAAAALPLAAAATLLSLTRRAPARGL